MCMRNYRKILCSVVMPIIAFGIALLFAGCKNETDTTLTQQQQSIEKYLQTSHNPRLIDEAEVGNSIAENPPFYTRWDMDLYRYIETYYDEGRDSKAEIVRGTTFEIIYTAYIFSGSAPTTANMYATNDAENIQKLQNEGLNTEYEWTSEPMKIKLGSDKLTSGLETALEGCREGDVVEIYMTYAEAYGNKYIGKVPSKSSVVWFIKITNVE